MSSEGKIPREEFRLDQWTTIEPSTDLREKAGLQQKVGVDPGTVKAGAEVVLKILSELLAYLGKIDRKVAIAINNYPSAELKMPKFSCWSGDVVDTTLRVGGDRAGFFTAQKKWGAYGTAGVLTYEIAGTSQRLAVMWSVPKGVVYKNWFKVSVISSATPTDSALFDDMYYDTHKLTEGNCAPADGGSAAWTASGYRLEAVMGTSGETTLNALIEKA